jgi:hypothetical protein
VPREDEVNDVSVPQAFDHHERERAEVSREGVTMALYVSLSQLAVMTAMPVDEASSNTALALTVALTSVGLVFAHQLAFRMSSRLVTAGSTLEPMAPRILRAQLIGGAAVTLLAVLPILVFGPGAYTWSMGLLLVFVMVVGYLVARSAPNSRARSLVYVAIVAVAVVGVLVIKSLVNH